MKKQVYKLKDRTWYELKKVWPIILLIGLAVIVFGDVSQIMMQLYTLSMTMFVLLAIYLVRRWLFPSISLTELAEAAKKSSTGAAIVYAAIIIFMVVILVITVGKA